MTNCTQESFQFPVLKRRIVEANFQGGDITSDGGVLLLQQVDRRLGLSEAVAHTLDDPRRQASVDHNGLSLLRQRVYALALGYEDLNDHESLHRLFAVAGSDYHGQHSPDGGGHPGYALLLHSNPGGGLPAGAATHRRLR